MGVDRLTETQALYNFWNGFGLKAYPSTSVPEDTKFPWLTYEVQTAHFGNQPVSIAVNLWYHTDSEAVPNQKAKEISDRIGMGGLMLPCDTGVMWIKRGTPWCINLADESDISIKRRQLNVTIEYLTL